MARYSAKRIRDLLASADAAPTADAKGALLEDLVAYLFAKVPGMSLHDKNILDGPRAHELDLAFWHIQVKSPVGFLDPILIVECKHKAAPVGSADVSWFVQKLRVRGAAFGILVALNGISGGGNGATSAHSEVLLALATDGVRILVIDRAEIEALRTTADLAALLKRKFLTLVLQRAVA
jgi:hypothetical protein